MDLKRQLEEHLTHIARERDPYLATEGHFYVQQYIRHQFQQWGMVETYEFKIQARTHTNLILNLPAQPGRENKPPILIGAHYDAVPGTPGADDNASGVAVLLELARSLSAQPARYPVQLIAFDLEEYGLLGSAHYAEALMRQKEPVRLMLSLEMLGYCSQEPNSQNYPPGLQYFYPNQGNFIGLIGNLGTIPDMIRLCGSIHKAGIPSRWLPAGKRGMIVQATRLSDHAPFWDRGYQAIMVTDTAFMRNPHYHQPSDRIETLNLDFLTGICQGLAIGLRHLQ
ncbi:M20/M25/M40 family metallo-hydrolase [Leptothermofonsia sp. ETS-13]|uniref:M20/M25/M40 family metallo-hydrolase n=1 Tax=Leptothermofonsia sp. ETS-13 TaxID=3035696 RepID=UPI003BA29B0E